MKLLCADHALNDETFTDKTIVTALKLYTNSLGQITKECTAVYWEPAKRKDAPDGAVDKVSKLRERLSVTKDYISIFMVKNLNINVDVSKIEAFEGRCDEL